MENNEIKKAREEKAKDFLKNIRLKTRKEGEHDLPESKKDLKKVDEEFKFFLNNF